MADYDLTGIQLNVELSGEKEAVKDLDKLIKQLEGMGVKVNVGLDTEEIKKQSKEVKTKITQAMDSVKINPELNQQAFSDLYDRLRKVRSEVDELAKVDIMTDKNSYIQKAILTYQDGIGKVVTETMAWKEVLDDASSTLTRTFETQGFKYSDNIAKEQAELLKQESKTISEKIEKEKTLISLNEQRYTLNKQVSALMKDSSFRGTDEYKDMAEINAQIKAIKQSEGAIDKEHLANLNRMISDLKIKLDIETRYLKQKDKEEDMQSRINKELRNIESIKNTGFVSNKDLDILMDAEKSLKNFKVNATDSTHELNKLKDVINDVSKNTKITESLKHQQKTLKENFELYRKTFDTNVMKIENKYSGLYDIRELRQQKEIIENIQKLISSDLTEKEIDEVNNKLKHVSKNLQLIQTQAQITSKGVKGEKDNQSWMSAYTNKFKNMIQYATLGGVFYEGKQLVSQSVENIRQLDSSLVELSKVSSVTRDEFGLFVKEANNIGNAVGKTSKDVIDAVTSFQRAGYTLSQSKDLASQALIMANISENMKDTGDNASALVNILKGYRMEVSEVSKINDVYNEISNNMAVNFDTLVSGSREIAGVMNIYGNSLENTASMITSIVEIMGTTGEETANALKTISLRLAGFNDEGEKDIELVSKLNDEFEKIAGMSLTKANGELKSTFEIVDEYSKKVKELNISEELQSFLGEKVAGKHRVSYWTAMVQNFDSARKAMEYANDSLNSSLEEQEKYVNSLDGQIEILKSSLMSLSYNSINTDWVINIVKATNEIVKLTDKIGIANIAMATFVGYMSAKSKMGIFNSVINSILSTITTYTTKMTGATSTTLAFGTAMKAMTGVGLFAGVMAGVAIFDKLHVSTDEQREKVSNLTSKMEELNGEYETLRAIQNPNQQEKERLDLLEKELEIRERILASENNDLARKEVFGVGQIADSGLSTKGNKLSYEIKQMSDEIDTLRNKLEGSLSDAEFIKISDEIEIKTGRLLGKRDELSLINDKLETSNKNLTGSEQELISKQIESQKAIIGLVNKNHILESSSKGVSEENKNVYDSISDIVGIVDAYTNKIDGNISSVETLSSEYIGLIDVIKNLQDGNKYSLQQALDIADKYGVQYEAIKKVEDGYIIELDALTSLRDDKVTFLNDMSIAEDEHKTVAIKNILARCQAIDQEIQSYKDLVNAKRAAINDLDMVKSKTVTKEADPFGIYSSPYMKDSISPVFEQAEKDIQQKVDFYDGVLKEWDRLESESSKRKGTLNDLLTGYSGEGKKSSSSSKKDNTIADKFKKDLEEIKIVREKIEYEISLLQEKMSLAELTGDTKEYDTLANKMTVLKDQLRGISEVQIGRFEGLAQLYKDTEQLGELESLIADARKQDLIDEQTYMQHIIDLTNQKYEAEKRSYDDKVRDIELQQALVKEGSESHIALEQQKVDLLLQMQQSYLEKVRQLKEAGLSQDAEDIRKYVDMYYDAEMEILNMQKAMAEQAKTAKLEAISKQVEQYEEQKKAQQDIFDMTMKMIKAEHEARKKALQDEIKGYEKIINKKKEALRDEYDKENAADELAEKQKVLDDIEKQLLMLEGVEGEDAKAKRIKLEEEKAKAIKEIDKFNREQLLQGQEDLLDKELENFKDKKEEEIKEIDDYLSKEGNIRDEALKRIDKKNKALYEQLKKYSNDYSTTSGAEFDKLWSTANQSIEGYTDKNLTLLDTMKLVTQELEKQKELHTQVGNSSWQENVPNGNAGGSQTNSNVKVIQQMMANSNKWQGADAKEKERLSAENAKLGSSINAYHDQETGIWWTDKKKTKKLYDSIIGVYHKGGIVGGNTSIKSSEEFAKLLKGEVVASIPQIDNFMNKTLPRIANGGGGVNINLAIEKLIDVDKLDNNVDIESITKRAINGVMKQLNSGFRNNGLRPSW